MRHKITKELLLFLGFIMAARSEFLPSIQWTPENPMIQHLKGKVRKVNIDDGLNLWCPKDYTQITKTKGQVQPSQLYFALYKVETKEEYDKCDASKGKRLLGCKDPEGQSTEDKEDHMLYFTENPIYKSMDAYPPGKTYFYIGTSGGQENELEGKVGGKCQSDNMKFAIYVCRKEENCNVDVLDGGWSMWQFNQETGLCERNCSNPEPQNGGGPCKGVDKIDCSLVMAKLPLRALSTQKTLEMTTAGYTKSSSEKTSTTNLPTKDTTLQETVSHISTTPTISRSNPGAINNKQGGGGQDTVALSLKAVVLTFIGLFIFGCVVGILLVLLILHFRSKQLVKLPELQSPVNHV